MHTVTGTREPADSVTGRFDDAGERCEANRAVGVSALGLAVTGVVELGIAVLTGSVGLLGDALHNLSDVSTSLVVFLGFRISRRTPSERYPYGLERAEDLAGLGVALVVWASAVVAGWESVHKLLAGSGTSHIGVGIAAAALGIVGNQLVARYKLGVGRRIHRPRWSATPNIPGSMRCLRPARWPGWWRWRLASAGRIRWPGWR
jgi:cation diffusion facilitator family transporter